MSDKITAMDVIYMCNFLAEALKANQEKCELRAVRDAHFGRKEDEKNKDWMVKLSTYSEFVSQVRGRATDVEAEAFVKVMNDMKR